MNRSTFTTKTGLTAIASIIGMGFGMYTGAVPIATGAQSIITGLLGLFLRDAVETNTVKTAEQAPVIEAARDAAADSNAAAQSLFRDSNARKAKDYDAAGGA